MTGAQDSEPIDTEYTETREFRARTEREAKEARKAAEAQESSVQGSYSGSTPWYKPPVGCIGAAAVLAAGLAAWYFGCREKQPEAADCRAPISSELSGIVQSQVIDYPISYTRALILPGFMTAPRILVETGDAQYTLITRGMLSPGQHVENIHLSAFVDGRMIDDFCEPKSGATPNVLASEYLRMTLGKKPKLNQADSVIANGVVVGNITYSEAP